MNITDVNVLLDLIHNESQLIIRYNNYVGLLKKNRKTKTYRQNDDLGKNVKAVNKITEVGVDYQYTYSELLRKYSINNEQPVVKDIDKPYSVVKWPILINDTTGELYLYATQSTDIKSTWRVITEDNMPYNNSIPELLACYAPIEKAAEAVKERQKTRIAVIPKLYKLCNIVGVKLCTNSLFNVWHQVSLTKEQTTCCGFEGLDDKTKCDNLTEASAAEVNVKEPDIEINKDKLSNEAINEFESKNSNKIKNAILNSICLYPDTGIKFSSLSNNLPNELMKDIVDLAMQIYPEVVDTVYITTVVFSGKHQWRNYDLSTFLEPRQVKKILKPLSGIISSYLETQNCDTKDFDRLIHEQIPNMLFKNNFCNYIVNNVIDIFTDGSKKEEPKKEEPKKEEPKQDNIKSEAVLDKQSIKKEGTDIVITLPPQLCDISEETILKAQGDLISVNNIDAEVDVIFKTMKTITQDMAEINTQLNGITTIEHRLQALYKDKKERLGKLRDDLNKLYEGNIKANK